MSNNTKSNHTYVEQMLPYQDWKYVEVVRDFHKHLGTDETRAHVRMLNDTVKPFKRVHGDAQSALRWLSLAAIGGLITPLCQRALELVREHNQHNPQQVAEKSSKPQATKEEIMQALMKLNPSSPTEREMAEKGWVSAETIDAEAKAKHRNTPSSVPATPATKQQAAKAEKSFEDSVKEAVFGSVEKANEARNDFFGFDFDKAFDMDYATYMHYVKECKRVGWRNVNI